MTEGGWQRPAWTDDWPLGDLAAERAARTPDRLALVDADDGTAWTYAELDETVARTATAVERLARAADVAVGTDGKASGAADRVVGRDGREPWRLGVIADPGVDYVLLVHAATRVGATVVLFDADAPPARLEPAVERAGVDALVCDAGAESTAAALADRVGAVASVDDPETPSVRFLDPPSSGDRADGGTGAAAGHRGGVRWPRNRTAVVAFTSGTTGSPKGVRLTPGNLVASAAASAERLGVDPGDRWLACLPMHHVGGLAPALRTAVYGTALVVRDGFDAGATADAIDRHGVTGVSLVPTALERLLDADWTPPAHLRFVLLGGAPAPPALIERCEHSGVPVCPTYGATETASQVATALPAEAFAHPETVGRPLSCTEVTVVGDDGTPAGPDETGEIVVSGPTVSPGYLDPAATERAFSERGFHTGDVGCRDDGRLRMLGRTDDAVVTGGETVHPAAVVAALREHPRVAEAAVVGLPDPEWGHRVAALVVPATEGVDAAVLRRHCEGRLAAAERPKTLAFADELPRTASGTVDREAVRERLRGEP